MTVAMAITTERPPKTDISVISKFDSTCLLAAGLPSLSVVVDGSVVSVLSVVDGSVVSGCAVGNMFVVCWVDGGVGVTEGAGLVIIVTEGFVVEMLGAGVVL